jgi:hypothetical protein
MRFFYTDPGLVNNLGHHANFCRLMIGELRRRGCDVAVFGHAQLDPLLRSEFSAAGHFRAYTYWFSDGDPICGWLNAFYIAARATHEDLARINDITGDDILYLGLAQPAQLMGLIMWMNGISTDRLPQIVYEFGTDPGVDLKIADDDDDDDDIAAIVPRDPRVDARGVLYRFAAKQISSEVASRLHLVTTHHASSVAFAALTGQPVDTLPLPIVPVTRQRSRAGKRPVTIAVLGHQRGEKGYQFMPQIAAALLQSREDIRILAHNGAPQQMPKAQWALREMAMAEPRLIIDERLAGPEIWTQLIDTSDLILCPYNPQRFALSSSAVAAEAIANAMPLVVPDGTSLAFLMREFGGGGVTFDGFEPESIIASTLHALDRFDELAAIAHSGAAQWGDKHGPRHQIDAMLAIVGKSAH